MSLRHGTDDDGMRWHAFSYPWASPDEDFALTEGQRNSWCTIDVAVGLPGLGDYAREDLHLLRGRLVRSRGPAANG